MNADSTVFGAVRLGYLVVGSRRLDEWKRFATQAMGLHLADESQDGLAFRMDAHARRLIIDHDASEDVLAVGWQLDDEAALAVVLGRLDARGVGVECIEGERAARRGVASLHRFTGPKGLLIELFTTPLMDSSPLDMLCSGFVTGAGGMGHLSVMSRDRERSIQFWRELFDARVSDTIEMARGGRTVLDVTFLRVNERHHSVAIAATRGVSIDMFRTRIQHVNIEAATVDDLSFACERCVQLGYRLTRGIGRHPNDKELSFYVQTPSGFEMEMGWDALTVEEAGWPEGVTYPNMSTWGHDIPGRFSSELGFGEIVNALRSLTRTEYLPW
ncbi:MAG: VOC family protein [Halioglobus sp.]